MLAQFFRFLLVGGAATAIQYAVLVALHSSALMPVVWASAIGFALGAVFNFVASYHFTFRSRALLGRSAVTYTLVSTMGLILNSAVLAIANGVAGWHYLLAQILATTVVLAWNFLLGRYVTFASPRGSEADS